MKSEEDIRTLLQGSYKEVEKALGIEIRNGQAMEGVRKALNWVQMEGCA